jgi:hypothetical protein
VGVKVTENDARAGRPDGTCFYCCVPVGDEHSYECVSVKHKVKVRAVIEYELAFPVSWGKDSIEFNLNESSRCASSIIDDLKKLDETSGCLCSHNTYEGIDERVTDTKEGVWN